MESEETRLENKIALVTESSRGIGASIAKRFAQEGARVALHGRDRTALFLASDSSSWISGIVLDVSGGAIMV